MDTNREKTMEAAISPTVAGSLALMRGHTPVWLLVETPKSPWRTFPSHRPYCTMTGSL